MKKILLIDGKSIASLAIARSLGQKKIEIHCGEEFKHNITAYSKFVKKNLIYSSPEKTPDKFIKDILEIIKNEKYELLICATDETILLLTEHEKEISKYTNLYLPNYAVMQKFIDKGETIKIANKIGVPTPKTFFPEENDINKIKKEVKYPILIRARISSGSRGIKTVNCEEEFDASYEEIKNDFGEPIIQEYIEKKGYIADCILLDDQQKEYAYFSYEKLKDYPIGRGPMVVGQSTNNEITKNYSLNLLKTGKFKGIAEVEYILDKKGNPLLLEVNPRFWMHVVHAIDSGVDLPYLFYKLARKEPIDPVTSFKTGVKYRWILPYEILWLLNTSNKLKGFKEFIKFWEKDVSFGIFSSKDLLPMFGAIAQSLYFLVDLKRRKMVLGR